LYITCFNVVNHPNTQHIQTGLAHCFYKEFDIIYDLQERMTVLVIT